MVSGLAQIGARRPAEGGGLKDIPKCVNERYLSCYMTWQSLCILPRRCSLGSALGRSTGSTRSWMQVRPASTSYAPPSSASCADARMSGGAGITADDCQSEGEPADPMIVPSWYGSDDRGMQTCSDTAWWMRGMTAVTAGNEET